MRRNAFGAKGALVVRSSRISPRAGTTKPSRNPPPTAPVTATFRKPRRVVRDTATDSTDSLIISSLLSAAAMGHLRHGDPGGLLDGGANARVGAAAADVAGHG